MEQHLGFSKAMQHGSAQCFNMQAFNTDPNKYCVSVACPPFRQGAFGWVLSCATGVLCIPWHPIQVGFEGRHPHRAQIIQLQKSHAGNFLHFKGRSFCCKRTPIVMNDDAMILITRCPTHHGSGQCEAAPSSWKDWKDIQSEL